MDSSLNDSSLDIVTARVTCGDLCSRISFLLEAEWAPWRVQTTWADIRVLRWQAASTVPSTHDVTRAVVTKQELVFLYPAFVIKEHLTDELAIYEDIFAFY